jgi:uroporphyrinogen-III decarboxylase
MVASGTQPYMEEHILKESGDYKAFEFILNNSELIPLYDSIREKQEEMGDIGFVVPMMSRSPFQQILINCVGEIPLFQMLHDSPGYVDKLLTVLDERYQEDIQSLAGLDWPYVEFDDNLDGTMTNPHLFKKYSLPLYQKYTDLLHAQGKKVGSHTDGNIKPLLGLLVESGLDVCESFTPAPVTDCTFSKALDAWSDKGPIIWGGIPSPLLEARTNEEEFRRFVNHVLDTIQDRPIILGIGDMVMSNNLIERVQYIAEQIEYKSS